MVGCNWICLKGNYDGYLIDFFVNGCVESFLCFDLYWFDKFLGGVVILKSYGVEVEGKVILDVVSEICEVVSGVYKVFLEVLFCLYDIDIYFFVYVGICSGVVFLD